MIIPRALLASAALALPTSVGPAPAACPYCTMVSYTLTIVPADSTRLTVEMRVHNPPRPMRVAFAADVEYPGPFGDAVLDIAASAASGSASVARESRDVWRVTSTSDDVTLRYHVAVAADDRNGRGSWTTTVRANGAMIRPHSTFLYLVDRPDVPHAVRLVAPVDWQITTALVHSADGHALYTAPTFARLLDSPILLGHYRSWSFTAGGAAHTISFWPLPDACTERSECEATPFDSARFVRGVERVARAAIDVFGGRAPYERYDFVFEDGAWSALEHARSVTIGVRAGELAADPDTAAPGLAHEYFHTWNLVGLHPRGRGAVSWRMPAPTPELWWSEGVTIYYQHALLLRAGIVGDSLTRANVARDVASYLRNPGNRRYSPEDASRGEGDPARTGGLRPDYYVQGTVLGAALDIVIRDSTDGRHTLDDAMRTLYDRRAGPSGFTGADVEAAVHAACGCDVHDFFARHVRAAGTLDLAPYFARVGLRLTTTRDSARDDAGAIAPDLRLDPEVDSLGTLRLYFNDPTGAWGRAGLRSGDALRTIDGAPVHVWADLRGHLRGARLGQRLRVGYVRTGKPATAEVVLGGYLTVHATLTPDPAASPRARSLGARWLRPAA